MGRPSLVEDEELLARLSRTFRDVGYEGASLARLSEATGLQKPSLYHRFPGGKEQMALEALTKAFEWLTENILIPLRSDAPPQERIVTMIEGLSEFYENGDRACLLNMLSGPLAVEGPFQEPIKATFQAWINALTKTLTDAGVPKTEAGKRAVRTVTLVQGSLVVARGLAARAPFKQALNEIAENLLDT